MTYPATLLCDFYKVSHRQQYPVGTTQVYSTWIARNTRIADITGVVAFGFQAFVRRYLDEYFHQHFFSRPVREVCAEYEHYIRHTLGTDVADSEHIRALHEVGYLPLLIRAVPEGTVVPLRVPMLTIENTDKRFPWLTNYIETLFSAECWQPTTAATLAREFRRTLDHYCELTGGDPSFVPFQGHDFSMRGMCGLDAAAASGAGHLLSFTGTDTIPAILYAEEYYDADVSHELIGTSIPATEHSVMCAYGQDELSSYRRLITEVYPAGFVSIVSDTWDLWKVVGEVLPALKAEILARNGRVVIRPDSGDPVAIICGDRDAPTLMAKKGLIECLWDIFGGTTTAKGYKVLDSHIGAIYGDAINLGRCRAICQALEAKGYASTNMVYGIGSYTYQYQTRDTFGMALKSTYAEIADQEVMLWKDPVTDPDRTKRSLKGRCVVLEQPDGQLYVLDGLTVAQQAAYGDVDLLQPIFDDGFIERDQTFAEVRAQLDTSGATRQMAGRTTT
jgi:nicotinamide phosphoribosyltransferase